ncbi:hypothetical protein MTP16_13445 [Hymenobacter monticola]|uniref:Uncharacterized protein n=1 Tax=Hymenobacter monticola TaxID=1705399 RepID=A0ABY4AYZ6_9BACT|nr:hypothetical protein [Hymenobacter monticola]UOE32133.1 hypothetical protein MTP16_13445 [Hymenobacter monticola]
MHPTIYFFDIVTTFLPAPNPRGHLVFEASVLTSRMFCAFSGHDTRSHTATPGA